MVVRDMNQAPFIRNRMGSVASAVKKSAAASVTEPADSSEFFSPPLPYAMPAAAMALGVDPWHAAKAAQLFNVLLSIGLTWALVRVAELVSPGHDVLKIAAVGVLMSAVGVLMLPV